MSKILIVDDESHLDALIRQKFRNEIKSGKFQFLFSRNGLEALNEIESQDDIDLVISDINMPEMDGLTLLDKIDEKRPDLKAIIISAYNDIDNVKSAMERGAFDFITKPLNLSELKDIIDRTLSSDAPNRQETSLSRHQKLPIQKELAIASRLQQSILPSKFPETTEFDLFATMQAAQDVAGDFYDYFWLSPTQLGIVVADVSGKGITAALFMGMARTIIKITAQSAKSVEDCLTKINEQLFENNETSMFVTMFYGILETKTGVFIYSNAGHCPPYLITEKGISELPVPNGSALGVIENITFHSMSLTLNTNDVIFIFTDGIPDAENNQGFPYGSKRLEKFLSTQNNKKMKELIESVLLDIDLFRGEEPPTDDITALALCYKGSP